LLTGGAVKTYGSAGVVTEAVAMARYLREHGGVAASECLLEEEAVCTLTNAVHAKRLLDAGGLWSGATTLLLVTSSCQGAAIGVPGRFPADFRSCLVTDTSVLCY
jgi:uncharacterized SAM-binding protein YcdF (DUF218 family)